MNKKFKEYVLSLGMTVNGNFAHGTVKGYETNASIQVTEAAYPVKIHISFYATEEQKRSINAALANLNIKRASFTFSPFGLTIGLNDFTVGGLVKKLPAILDSVFAVISGNGATGAGYCPVCGKPLEEGQGRDCHIDGFSVYLDNDCVETLNSRIAEDNKRFENAPNNYLRGFLGAAIGGVAGAACAIILFLIGFVAAISSVISVLLGAYLYEKFGGKPNKVMLLIVSVTTIVFMALSVLIIYVWAASIIYEAPSAIEAFKIALADSEFSLEFYSNLLMTLLFSLVGAGVEIFYMARKIKRRKNF